MTTLPIYQVDAFADRPFAGNPAAVIPLDAWLPDALLQAIALENNLSETAFLVGGDGQYDLRWFTPAVEVDLCGHATLATAHVVFNHLGFTGEAVRFQTKSGELTVRREGALLSMDFPARPGASVATPAGLPEALGAEIIETVAGPHLVNLVRTPAEVMALRPDFNALAGVIEANGFTSTVVTAPYDGPEEWDFVSRMFAPSKGINEDPVTGAAHCALAPYWAERLGKHDLVARQVSSRGGTLWCTLAGERVILRGSAVDYLKGQITI
jgi:PhzF family phenazine biosynthesis protein